MNRVLLFGLWAATLAVAGIVGWRANGTSTDRDGQETRPPRESDQPLLTLSPIQPLPLEAPLDDRKVALGERLFGDARLSRDGKLSCSSCHDLADGGDDGRRVPVGVDGAEGLINVPSVLNCAFNFRQFGDGRAATLEEQVGMSLQGPAEMASSREAVETVLRGDGTYRADFSALYPDGPTFENLCDALATFERSLVTPDSRFDRFLRGDICALTVEELEGYRLFTDVGCATCHQGVNLGGNMFQAIGYVHDYFQDRGGETAADAGRISVTGDPEDLHKFKVPSLRNVALTAPYMRDGTADTLGRATQVMAYYQIGEGFDDRELGLLVAFMGTLTGERVVRP